MVHTSLQPLEQAFHRNAAFFHPVVKFDPKHDKLLQLDFTSANETLTEDIYSDLNLFSRYVNAALSKKHFKYGIGGYKELRTIYAASNHFDGLAEPRRLHLGVDIWAEAGTPIYAFAGGRVHSFKYNAAKGDYGATLILMHQLDGLAFHTLYGHISLRDIETLSEGQYMIRCQEIAHFGQPMENGHWPPHLHFQIIIDMEGAHGDYPGVCAASKASRYIKNCPDPDLILQLNRYNGHR